MPLFPPPSTSGSTITDPGVAYVRSNGNDSTGDGTPAKPFLTFQAAMDHASNYVSFDFGVGSFGGCNVNRSGDLSITVRGRGYALSNCAGSPVGYTGAGGGTFTIKDDGVRSVQFSQIGVDGAPAGNLVVEDIYTNDKISAAGASDGANAGTVTVLGACHIGGGVECGGFAGSDGTPDTPGGNGGNGGNVTITGPSIAGTVQTTGGVGGADGGDGGGSNGSDGHLAASQGASIPTPTANTDVPTYAGILLNGIFILNAIPCPDGTTSPVTSMATVSGQVTAKA